MRELKANNPFLLAGLVLIASVVTVFFPKMVILLGIMKAVSALVIIVAMHKPIENLYMESLSYFYFIGLLQFAKAKEDFMRPELLEAKAAITDIVMLIAILFVVILL